MNAGSTNEILRIMIAKHGGPRPPKGTSESELRSRLRGAMEAQLDATDPVAAYDAAEREAWKGLFDANQRTDHDAPRSARFPSTS
jgi:hypothetical protein